MNKDVGRGRGDEPDDACVEPEPAADPRTRRKELRNSQLRDSVKRLKRQNARLTAQLQRSDPAEEGVGPAENGVRSDEPGGEGSGTEKEPAADPRVRRKRLRKNQLRNKVRMLRRQNARLTARLMRAGPADKEGVRAEDVVWILGSGRTGSSWLSFMMGEMPRHARWNEPLVGYLFAHAYYERGEHRLDERYFVLGDDYKDTWLGALRSLVLDGAAARFPEVDEGGGYVVIKEPHGSRGASFLSEALPESRMILLVRDPRDVAISALHATWAARQGTVHPRESRQKTVLEFRTSFSGIGRGRTRRTSGTPGGRTRRTVVRSRWCATRT